MSLLFAQQNHIQIKNQYGLEMADGSLKMVDKKQSRYQSIIQQHHKIIIFDDFGLVDPTLL